VRSPAVLNCDITTLASAPRPSRLKKSSSQPTAVARSWLRSKPGVWARVASPTESSALETYAVKTAADDDLGVGARAW
jgi:hypothetical protein